MPPEPSRGVHADTPRNRAARRAPTFIDEGPYRASVIARRDALAIEHLYLVPPIARRLARRLPRVYDVEDLIAVGYQALLSIALRYRPESHGGAPFSAFARPRIRGAMLDSIRLRHVTQTRWAEMLSIDADASDPEVESDWMRGWLRSEPEVEDNIDAQRLAARVAAAIRRLAPLRAAILDRYYSPEMPGLASVAESLGLPVARVARERAAAVADLKRWLGV